MSFGNRPGQVRFVDVAEAAGISRQGQTWGITLFDFNNDGYLDIYQNNHQQKPVSIFVNRGDGTFDDMAPQLLPDGAPGDFHGAISIDYNNDGISELFQVAGGDLGAADDNENKNNRFFVRQGKQFVDQSEELGIDYPLGRGRMPLKFDFNDDGRLDVLYTGPKRPDNRSFPTIFLQTNDGFNLEDNTGLDIDVPNGAFAVLGDVTGDHRQELLYVTKNPKITIYDTSELPLNDVTAGLLPASLLSGVTNIKDIAVGDFNGDTFQDLFIIQQGTGSSGYRLDSTRSGRAKLKVQRESEALKFKNAGDISLNFQGDPSLTLPTFFLTPTLTTADIFIGASARNPNSLVFSLNSNSAMNRGRPDFEPGSDNGVYIWFDVASNEWIIEASSSRRDDINFLFETESVPRISTEGFNINLNGKKDVLLTYDPDLGRFVNSTTFANLDGTRIAGRNVVSGDFDNDTDLDFYIVATANTQNLPNVLLENLGNGRFREVPGAAGAAGTDKGIGDTVVVGDYDVNGFLDFVVTNGDALGFDRPFALDGFNHLFQNQGNGNHSIQIDLVGNGINTNRDATGAKVYVTTPDGKRQVREQTGGVHNRGQDFPRLHFGLGDQETVSALEVIWPNGDSQTFSNVGADQVIRLVQGSQAINTLFTYEPAVPDSTVTGTPENDTLVGSALDNTINGLAGDDLLKGLKGNDRLVGGAGKDTLIGGPGEDRLRGGAGADDFLFMTRRQGGDVIEDFLPSMDDIVVSAKGFKAGLSTGVLPSDRFVVGALATDARDRFIYNPNQKKLWFDSDGTGRQSATLIATFVNSPALTSNDIVVI